MVVEFDSGHILLSEYIETPIANTDYAIRIIDLKTEAAVYEVNVLITNATAYTVTFCQEDYLSTLSQVKHSYGEKKYFQIIKLKGIMLVG